MCNYGGGFQALDEAGGELGPDELGVGRSIPDAMTVSQCGTRGLRSIRAVRAVKEYPNGYLPR